MSSLPNLAGYLQEALRIHKFDAVARRHNRGGGFGIAGFFVTLHRGSERAALQMNHTYIVTTERVLYLRQWGFLENWKSTAQFRG